MIDILTEISLVQAARNYNKMKLEMLGVDPGTYIYNKFEIDSVQFEQSSAYYSEHYIQYDRMYDSVKARIKVLKLKTDSIQKAEIKIEDSIKNARKDSIRTIDSLGVETTEIDTLQKRRTIRLRDSLIVPPSAARIDALRQKRLN